MTCRSGAAAAVLLVLAVSAASATPADCSKAPIPPTPARGTVSGHAFTPTYNTIDATPGHNELNGIKLDEYNLALSMDDISNQLKIVLAVRTGEKLGGRTFRMTAGDDPQPAVGPGVPEVQGWDLSAGDVNANFVDEAATLRVELGTHKGKSWPGKVYFCLPKYKTEIMGTFTATTE